VKNFSLLSLVIGVLVCCLAMPLPGCKSSGGGADPNVGGDDSELSGVVDDDDDNDLSEEIETPNPTDDDDTSDDDDAGLPQVFDCVADQVCRLVNEDETIWINFSQGYFEEDSEITLTELAQQEVIIGSDSFEVLAAFELTFSADPVSSPVLIIETAPGTVDTGDQLLIVAQVPIEGGRLVYIPVNTATLGSDGQTVTTANDWDKVVFENTQGITCSATYFVLATDLDYGYLTGSVLQPDGQGAAGQLVFGSNPQFVGFTDEEGSYTIFTPLGPEVLICSSYLTGAYGHVDITVTDIVRYATIGLKAPAAINNGLTNGCFDHTDWSLLAEEGEYQKLDVLYPLPPTQGSGMLLLGTGEGSVDGKSSNIEFTFTVPESKGRLVFEYLVLSDEYPGRMDTTYNDFIRTIVYDPLQGRIAMQERVLTAGLYESPSVYGGQAEWRQVSIDVSDVAGANIPVTLSFAVNDVRDTTKDTAVLIDNLHWESEACDNPWFREDSDGDTIYDDEEVLLGTDPYDTDSDGDGLDDGEEYHVFGTDPGSADGDGDGLSDDEELFEFFTNPNEADSDGDLLNDFDEIFSYQTDPLDEDSDNDQLYDGLEIAGGTDPNDKDTDSDSLLDGEEVLQYGTDPLSSDTDSDGLYDAEELTEFGTDPNLWDTDGDSWSDLDEVSAGSNPNDVDQYPDTCGEVVVLADMSIWKSEVEGAGIEAHSNERFLINLLGKAEFGKFLLYCGFGGTTVAGYRCSDIAGEMNDHGWHAEYSSVRPLDLEGYRVVVLWTPFFNTTAYPEPVELAAIKDFINGGGRLIMVVDNAGNYDALQNILLDNLGVSEINIMPQTIGAGVTTTTEIGINFLNSLVSKVGFDRAGRLTVTEGGEVLLGYEGNTIAAYKGYGPEYCGAGKPPEGINLSYTGFYQDCDGDHNIYVELSVLNESFIPIWGINSTNIVVLESINGEPFVERDESVIYDTAGKAIAAALTMDYSGSMAQMDIEAMEQAVSSFVDELQTNDRAEIIKFGSTVEVKQEFTGDRALLQDAAEAPYTGGGYATNLYGSIYIGLDHASVQQGNKAILAFTDGWDNIDFATKEEIVEHANLLGIPVYTIGYGMGATPDQDNPLVYIAGNTGGLYYQADAANLAEIYEQISDIVKSRYSLEWETTAQEGDVVEVVIEVTVQLAGRIETFSIGFTYIRGATNCRIISISTAIGGTGEVGNCGNKEAEVFLSVINQLAMPIHGLLPVNIEVEESLDGGDFTLIESPVEIYGHVTGDSANSISLLLDYSAEMSSEDLIAMQSAATEVVDSLLPTDRGQVINFADGYEVAAEFTDDRELLVDAVLAGTALSDAATHLYDAIYAAISNVAAQNGYRAVVAFTNGYDGGSTHSLSELIDLAVEQRVVVYTIGLDAADETSLFTLAAQSDGAYFYAETSEELPKVFADVSNLLANTYRVVYMTEAGPGRQIDADIGVQVNSQDGIMLADNEMARIDYSCFLGSEVSGAIDFTADVTAVVSAGQPLYEWFDAGSPFDMEYSGLSFKGFGSMLYDYQVDLAGDYDPNSFSYFLYGLSYCDDCAEEVPIPFDFDFYGVTYDSMWVSTNGLVSFGGPYTAADADVTELSATGYGFILPFYDDFTTMDWASDVYYSYSQNQAIVTWYALVHAEETGLFNVFQLKLVEGGDFEISYNLIHTGDNGARVGIIPPVVP
jgi:uncharacterized protein YegL